MQKATGPVLAIGECMVEFFDRGDGFWQRGFAGDTLNVAWALRALLPADVPVGYVTRVGQDAVSQAMVDFIAAAGIGTASISRDPDRTVGLYTIATDAAGERSFSYWRQASAARHLADDEGALATGLTGARLVYLSGITAAILAPAGRATLLTALKQAKAQGARIVHDPNHRPRLWQSRAAAQAFARQIAGLADILLPSFDDEAPPSAMPIPRPPPPGWSARGRRCWHCGDKPVGTCRPRACTRSTRPGRGTASTAAILPRG
jgi:2-dehydro-3-deoxygluconokinase